MVLRYVRYLALLLGCLWFPFVEGVTLTHLYEVDLPLVPDQPPEVTELADQGLETIALRLAGEDKQSSVLRALHSASGNWLKTYHIGAQSIHLVYNGPAIESALQQANVSYWGQNRPLTLLWLGAETMQSDFLHDWQKQAMAQGLPLVLPILDLETLESPNIDEMKKRYEADVVWLGTLRQRGDMFIAEWDLTIFSERMQWEVKASSLEELWKSSLGTLDEQLRKQYAAQESWYNREGAITLEVINVRTAKSAANLLRYLKKVNGVKKAQIQALLPPDIMRVELLLSGGDARLEQTLTLDKRLIPVGNQQYRWVGSDEK